MSGDANDQAEGCLRSRCAPRLKVSDWSWQVRRMQPRSTTRREAEKANIQGSRFALMRVPIPCS